MLRVLIIGAGDVARRILPLLVSRCRVYALLRDAGKASWWRDQGARPLIADLDQAASLHRIGGILRTVRWVIYLAPPGESTRPIDPRLQRLLALRPCQQGRSSLTQRWVYISTTGVYGDLAGNWADETQPCAPVTGRGRRRVDAERQLRRHCVRPSVLRVPGIYAADRLPVGRLQTGTPVLRREDDVFTSHIHADDLARIVVAALRRGRPNRVYHAVDDSAMRMGDYFDAVADRFNLPRPPRVTRDAALREISPALLSFMSESRRLRNRRLKNELQVVLRYPTVADGLCADGVALKQ